QESAIEPVELERFRAVDTLRLQRAPVALGVVMRVHGYALDRLAGPVQPRAVRRADLDPGPDRAGQIAHLERRPVRIRESLREDETLTVLETEGEHASAQELL